LSYLWEPEDASYLAFFRIFWGLVMTYEVYLFMLNDYGKTKATFYSNPYGWNVKYYPFEWVAVLPFDYMRGLLIMMFLAGSSMIVGFQYKKCAVFFFFSLTYVFLAESSTYLNHIYLCCCMAFVMMLLPCECCYSIDSKLNPKVQSDTVPK
jgi:hypothetical protein